MSTPSSVSPGFWRTLKLALVFSLREMRGGLKGFRIFLACVALGVAAIGSVNTIAGAITGGLEREGRSILGGDIRFELNQREATQAERDWLDATGTVTITAGMRSMARRADESDQTLVELKAVDQAWPLYGTLVTEPPLERSTLFDERDGAHGAVVAPILLDRLALSVGDRLRIGTAEFEIRAAIVTEPDLASDGFGFAPRFLTSLEGLAASGLVQPGSLVEWGYKIALAPGRDAASIRTEAEEAFPEAGWSIRTAANAAPALANNIDRFSSFLTLLGLSVLVVGGVGIANAVRAHLDSKREVIATLKCLGGSGTFVFTLYLAQILLLAAGGIVIGVLVAAIAPWLASGVLARLLPVPLDLGLDGRALALAGLFGVIATLTFAILPLGLARDVPATAMFRNHALGNGQSARLAYRLSAGALALALAGLALLNADNQRVALTFIGGVMAAFLILRLVAWAIQRVARATPHPRSTALRLALGNIHRPGALTPAVVLSLGLGLTLLASIAMIDTNLRNQITGNIAERAPNFFFVDIRSQDADSFAALATELAPGGKLIRVPMLRGRITAINGQDPSTMEFPNGGRWVLRGDRGITYAKNVPENSRLVAGQWWDPDHQGDNLVSFSAEEAGELGLGIGDSISVNVLGRTVTATIANLREVEWESLGINFVMVFSPNTFAGAPHSWLATLTLQEESAQAESAIVNAMARAFPAVTTVRISEALEIANRLVGQLSAAVRAAAIVAIAASVLVLAGALAAGNRARQRDAVVLKTLGATRRLLMKAYLAEYAVLGLATGLFALAFGSVAAWYVIEQVMTLKASLSLPVALSTLAIALVVTVGTGLAGTWRLLGQRAAPALREP